MKTPNRTHLRWLALFIAFVGIFLGVAAVGRIRERNDIEVMRTRFKEREAELRSKIDQIGDGVTHEVFWQIMPHAYQDAQNNEWVISIPTDYNENPACTNIFEEKVYFKTDGDFVRQDESKSGAGFVHGDRFGIGGVWYYFWRAWYSSVESDEASPLKQKKMENKSEQATPRKPSD